MALLKAFVALLATFVVINQARADSCTASLRNLVAKHEGDKLCVYVDTTGHKTIGIGYNLDQNGARQMILNNFGPDTEQEFIDMLGSVASKQYKFLQTGFEDQQEEHIAVGAGGGGGGGV